VLDRRSPDREDSRCPTEQREARERERERPFRAPLSPLEIAARLGSGPKARRPARRSAARKTSLVPRTRRGRRTWRGEGRWNGWEGVGQGSRGSRERSTGRFSTDEPQRSRGSGGRNGRRWRTAVSSDRSKIFIKHRARGREGGREGAARGVSISGARRERTSFIAVIKPSRGSRAAGWIPVRFVRAFPSISHS